MRSPDFSHTETCWMVHLAMLHVLYSTCLPWQPSVLTKLQLLHSGRHARCERRPGRLAVVARIAVGKSVMAASCCVPKQLIYYDNYALVIQLDGSADLPHRN